MSVIIILCSTVEDQGFAFAYVVSERVGRTNAKEQYGVIYRFLTGITCIIC